MNVIDQLSEYKSKFEALASKAAQSELLEQNISELNAKISAFEAEKAAQIEAITALNDEKAILEEKVSTLTAELEALKANQAAAEQKALEICASMGLSQIPVITVTESDKPSADSVRAKYASLNGREKALFYKENKDLIERGY